VPDVSCPWCDMSFSSVASVVRHASRAHGKDRRGYDLLVLHAGAVPKCECGCGQDTEYHTHDRKFNRFVRGHQSRDPSVLAAMVEGGRAAPQKHKEKKEMAAPATTARDAQTLLAPNYRPPLVDPGVQDIAQFIQGLGFRTVLLAQGIIPSFKLDVWVPDKKLAVEHHDLFWPHGFKEDVFTRGRHRDKHLLCRERDIRLIQFFSDEWNDCGDICRSILSNALSVEMQKLNARDCEVCELTASQAREFFDSNHICGWTRSKHTFGLVHPMLGLVGAASVRTPIQKKWGRVCELARMAFRCGASVRGGASKLLDRLKGWSQDNGFDGIISYAELRFGNGGVYEKCGFKLAGETTVNYGYTDGNVRYDRFKYRAQPGKPEKQVVEEAGVRPVWGSGNRVYLWKPGAQ